jgi:hypothetical protein
MNAMPSVIIIGALFLFPQGNAPFKTSVNPLTDALRTSLVGASRNMVRSAELMPAEKYRFHPTPA